jgi:hypothetical protein
MRHARTPPSTLLFQYLQFQTAALYFRIEPSRSEKTPMTISSPCVSNLCEDQYFTKVLAETGD